MTVLLGFAVVLATLLVGALLAILLSIAIVLTALLLGITVLTALLLTAAGRALVTFRPLFILTPLGADGSVRPARGALGTRFTPVLVMAIGGRRLGTHERGLRCRGGDRLVGRDGAGPTGATRLRTLGGAARAAGLAARDGGDEIVLAHLRRPGDPQARCDALELGDVECREAGARHLGARCGTCGGVGHEGPFPSETARPGVFEPSPVLGQLSWSGESHVIDAHARICRGEMTSPVVVGVTPRADGRDSAPPCGAASM